SVTIDQDEPGLVRTEHTLSIVPASSQSVRLSNEASLRVDAGPDGVNLNVDAAVADDPYLLPESKPAVRGEAIGARYFEFESHVTSGQLQSVAITMNLRALGLPSGVDHPDVRFYYWVGDRWVAIDAAKVTGEGEPDLVVLGRTADSAK